MRLEFTAKTKREALERSGGICECHRIPGMIPCGLSLTSGNVFFEHIEQDAIVKKNSLDNCAALTKTCWKFKTAKIDQPTIARVRKRRDRNYGIKKTRRGFPGWRKFNGDKVWKKRP
jgi:hypothetical protein